MPGSKTRKQMSEERIMKTFAKTGPRTGGVLSLTAAMIIMPEVILAGPGCMNNQRMAPAYYPQSPMGPQMAYGQRTPYSYYPAPAPYARMMPAPYNRPMTTQHNMPAVDAGQAASAKNAIPSSGAAAGESMSAGESVTVRIDGMRFIPEKITVKPGTTVTWVHGSQMPHTISGNADGLRSGTLYNGQQFSHTFSAEGSYDYICGLHPSMTGSVVVDEAAADG
jgi:plastocyanin